HCRECQYIAGGGPNFFMLMPPGGFRYVNGAPKTFTRDDIPNPVTREFCEICGTHLTTRRPGLPMVILKVGTLDDPTVYGDKSQMAINMIDKEPFHLVAEGVPTFDRLPPRT
ncbi:MAG: GFA family protein, partial [Caulobacteraceae bacterium]|nr:GFA family protein [Caulobacteraceae bacterium]